MTPRVFIGSTSKDLADYRQAAIDACLRLDCFPVAMEHFEAMGVGATEGSLRKLDEADVYVGIFAFRYGYIEDGYHKSVTELEFDGAGQRGLDRLCFLADPDHKGWAPHAMDLDNRDKLDAFKSRINTLIRAQFTSVDNFSKLLIQALAQWRLGQQSEVAETTNNAALSATVITQPEDTPRRAKTFIGRDALRQQIPAWLKNGETALLHGFGGMGKSALAAEIVKDWDGVRLWLEVGHGSADAILDGLANAFGIAQEVTPLPTDRKIRVMRDALRQLNLLVLDDAWNGQALHTVLQAKPDSLPVIVTARQSYPIDGRAVAVAELSPDEALALLQTHAQRDFDDTQDDARDLVKLLGHHAFAVEIAGKTLRHPPIPPNQLQQRIADAPHDLKMPLELAAQGRSSVADLLEVSLQSLSEESRHVFLAMGAFFAPRMTPLTVELFFQGTPDITDEMLKQVREAQPELENVSDDDLRGLLLSAVLQQRDGSEVLPLLDELTQKGLASFVPATEKEIASYRVHDLAQSYARAQLTLEQRQRALQACLNYTKRYNEPSLDNFAALRPEMDNLLGAAEWAFRHAEWAAVEDFAWNLYVNSQILGYDGYYRASLTLLEQAAQAAEKTGNRHNQGAHLGNLGLAYANLGEVRAAIGYHEQALAISREIGDRRGEEADLGNLGNAYFQLGEVREAIGYYEQALAISRAIGDKRAQGSILGNLGLAYRNLGEVDKAIGYHKQALAIRRAIGDRRGEGADLGNLGNAYFQLGEVREAIGYHEQALAISREIGDRRGEGNDLGNLGIAYADLGEVRAAIGYYEQALAISREIGDRRGEGADLGNLGNAYFQLGEVRAAIGYHEKALAISREIGDRMGEGNDLNNLGEAYETLEDYPRALALYQQALALYEAIGAQHLVEQVNNNIADVERKMNEAPSDDGQ